MNIHDLDTPAVLIDVDTMDRNLQGMASYCAAHNLALRPHTKTHKIPQIARLQMKYGAPGITVAKLGEAEVMADAGLNDIVIVYPLWGEMKWKRLAELARRVKISVAMDSFQVAGGISQAAKAAGVEVGIRLEFDTGLRRCGLTVDDRSIEIAKRIFALPSLRWEGISLYPGHIMGNRKIREQGIRSENAKLARLFSLLDSAGIPYPVVSGGNTPAAFQSHEFHGATEIRPGTYIFNDRNTVDAESASYADCAVTVLTTVVRCLVPAFRAHQDGSLLARLNLDQGPSRRNRRVKKNGPQAIGKWRGGWNTKIHMVAADARTAVVFALSSGNAHDAPGGRSLLEELGPMPEGLPMLMDKAYEGNETRQLVLDLGMIPVVPPKSNRLDPREYDRELYKKRNEVERLFRRLKGFRRIFSRLEKLDVVFLAFINFVLIVDALK